jgi:hypothetical protein
VSDIAENLREILDEMSTPDGENRIHMIDSRDENGTNNAIGPGYTCYHHHAQHNVVNAIRRVYRTEAGRSAPVTGEVFLDRTKPAMRTALLETVAAAIADGILVGQEHLFMVRKAKRTEQYHELFNSESYKKESSLFKLTLMMDPDLTSLVAEKLDEVIVALADGTGYAESTEPSIVSKVWDLWYLIGGSITIAGYKAGCTLGSKWKERDILAGISAATEGKTSDDDQ